MKSNALWAFTKYTTQKLITKPKSASISCYQYPPDIKCRKSEFKTSGNVFLGYLGE